MLINFYNLENYVPILVFLFLGFIIASTFIVLPLFLNKMTIEKNKLSSYECGSYIIGKNRAIFDARFYLIAMLFILFDLEILFILPWVLNFSIINIYGFFTGILFLFILGLGFIYEWRKGALQWE